MSAPAQPQKLQRPPAGYTGMDDVLIPTPTVPFTIKSETYPFSVMSVGGVPKDVETTTTVYVTSEAFETPTSTPELAERWIKRHSDPKSKFQLLSRMAVASSVPAVLDEKGKVFSSPLVKSMGETEFKSKLTYIEVPFGSQHIYGHADDGGLETEVVLESAYKTSKKFRLYIRAKSAAVSALLPLLYDWLAQFKILH